MAARKSSDDTQNVTNRTGKLFSKKETTQKGGGGACLCLCKYFNTYSTHIVLSVIISQFIDSEARVNIFFYENLS